MACCKKKPFYRFKVASDLGDIDNKEAKAKDIWGGFKEQTTAHGIPHVDQAKGTCKVTFWIVVTLACCGMLIWQLYTTVSYFILRPVDVVIALEHQPELTFPAVTICNLNAVKYSTLNYSSELEALVLSSRRRRRSAWGDEYDGDPRMRRQRRDADDNSEEAYEILAGTVEETKVQMGYTQEEFILDCQYAGSDCDMTTFRTYFDPIYGNCYIFNSGWHTSSKNIETSKRAGRRHGLKFVLNVKQDEYVEEVSQGAGARVLISAQERMPFPSDEGILTMPGQITSIGMRQVYISRLSTPFGNCTYANKTNEKRNVYEEFYDVRYSSNACFKTCYQKNVIEDCDCADPLYPSRGRAFGTSTPVAICRSADTAQTACKDRVSDKYQENKLNCECPTQCIETAYSFEVSSVQWPSDVHEQTVVDTYAAQAPEIAAANDSIAKMRRNLLKVEVYFQEFNYETMIERPAYYEFNFLSDIGGILGLWLGLSLLSVFEFFELGFDYVVFLCLKCRRRHEAKPDTPPPPYSSKQSSGRNSASAGIGGSVDKDQDTVFTKRKSHHVLGFV